MRLLLLVVLFMVISGLLNLILLYFLLNSGRTVDSPTPFQNLVAVASKNRTQDVEISAKGLQKTQVPVGIIPVEVDHHHYSEDEEDERENDLNLTPRVALTPLYRMPKPVVMVMTYLRVEYLATTLDSLFSLPGIDKFAVIISQDGFDRSVQEVSLQYSDKAELKQWERVPTFGVQQHSHAYLAQHYGRALEYVFSHPSNYSHVIIVEDDMIFSPDFLSLFERTAYLLEIDETLMCVSSWNDNGFNDLVDDHRRLFRTSYFPGLGWMMRRQLWLELGPVWPHQHWDHFMRLDSTHKGRECIVPEISRNFNIGVHGAHIDPTTYQEKLARIRYSKIQADFGDLSYLLSSQYETGMQQLVNSAIRISSVHGVVELLAQTSGESTVLVAYEQSQIDPLANALRIWNPLRALHQHTTILKVSGHVLILADRRMSPYLKGEEHIPQPASLLAVEAQAGDSCELACRQRELHCHAPSFQYINNCVNVTAHFACSRGCHMETGRDMPNLVVEKSSHNYDRCLISEEAPTCTARHPDTRRLCACIGNGR
jgi:alpha-1,3-mannosyl-glycoprotein beta-1,2-N-acetylglucosaminyltransferase